MTSFKNRTPKVLVLMASFNPPPEIKNQVRSILSQKNVDLDLVISDDNSDFQYQKNLNYIRDNFPNVQIISRKKKSGSASQNFFSLFDLVNVSKYDYVSFSDQDDLWDKSKIYRATTILDANDAMGYSSSTLAIWPNGKKKILHQSPKITKCDFLFEGAGQGCSFVLKADFFIKVQEFCLKNKDLIKDFYYHDWLVYLLCRSWNMSWYFDKKTTMRYIQHSNNDTGARLGISAILKRFKLISSGWYKNQIILATNISIKAGVSSDTVHQIHDFLNNHQIILSRILSLNLFFKHGRRKFSDRAVLCVSCILGYI